MSHNIIIHSDQHMHNWGSFSKTTPNGLNSRLEIQLSELEKTYQKADEVGARLMVYAGDLFHKRGEIKPTIFNPVYKKIKELHKKYPNITAIAIAGNHDLESNFSDPNSNAPESLRSANFITITQPTYLKNNKILLIPWMENLSNLMQELDSPKYSMEVRAESIVVIHAPINGVIKGIPHNGLNNEDLKALGWKCIYAGHYHNYKVYDGVISIGALTHQTWNDIGTKAGFIHIHGNTHTHYESGAPKFIDLNNPTVTEDDIVGNYVQYESDKITATDAEIRQELLDKGALGVVINITKKPTFTRTSTITKTASLSTIENAIDEYVNEVFSGNKFVQEKAQEIYKRVKNK